MEEEERLRQEEEEERRRQEEERLRQEEEERIGQQERRREEEQRQQEEELDYTSLIEQRRKALRARIAQIRGQAPTTEPVEKEEPSANETILSKDEEEEPSTNETILTKDEEEEEPSNDSRMSVTSRKLLDILNDIRQYNQESERHEIIMEEDEDDPDL